MLTLFFGVTRKIPLLLLWYLIIFCDRVSVFMCACEFIYIIHDVNRGHKHENFTIRGDIKPMDLLGPLCIKNHLHAISHDIRNCILCVCVDSDGI